jgi:DNA-directed RNA polymerase specialized sigma subunit
VPVTAKQITDIQKAGGKRRELLLGVFIKENEALVDYVVLKFAAQWKLEHHLEDLKQQARLAMVKAVGSFKVKKNGVDKKTGKRFSAKTWNCASYFSNWFWLISRDELQKAAKLCGEVDQRDKRARHKPLILPLQDSYSGTASQGSATIGFGDTIVLGQCDNQELLTAINELPPVERLIVQALAKGDTPTQIGARFGIDDPSAFIESIRRKLL